jgi:hypothetical protein
MTQKRSWILPRACESADTNGRAVQLMSIEIQCRGLHVGKYCIVHAFADLGLLFTSACQFYRQNFEGPVLMQGVSRGSQSSQVSKLTAAFQIRRLTSLSTHSHPRPPILRPITRI